MRYKSIYILLGTKPDKQVGGLVVEAAMLSYGPLSEVFWLQQTKQTNKQKTLFKCILNPYTTNIALDTSAAIQVNVYCIEIYNVSFCQIEFSVIK